MITWRFGGNEAGTYEFWTIEPFPDFWLVGRVRLGASPAARFHNQTGRVRPATEAEVRAWLDHHPVEAADALWPS